MLYAPAIAKSFPTNISGVAVTEMMRNSLKLGKATSYKSLLMPASLNRR